MTFLLVATALGSAAVLTWLQLRRAGAVRAVAVPSVQHLLGASPPRRRSPPLEEPLPFLFRLGALLLAVLGVWSARSGCTADRGPVAVVDPGAQPGACARARALPGVAATLCFQGDTPSATGADAARLGFVLGACSDTRPACLLRAAQASGRPVLLVGAFDAAAWRPALARFGRGFSFLREGASGQEPAPPSPEGLLRPRIRLEGTSAAAQVWAAALERAAGDGAPETGGGAPLVIVQDANRTSDVHLGAALTVTAAEGVAPAGPTHPGVESRPATGLLFPDPLDLGAGTAGLGLQTSLAFLPDSRYELLLPLAAFRRGAAGIELAVAATAEDLGRWAHQGDLLPLAHALLAAGLPPPARMLRPPVGGALGWSAPDGRQAPVGLLDVAPGLYRRSDGRAVLPLERPQVVGRDPLDDAVLVHLGGRAWTGAGVRRPSWATVLLGAACLLWLLGLAGTWRIRRAWLPALGAAVLLGLLATGATWSTEVTAPWTVALAMPPGPDADRLAGLLRTTTAVASRSGDAPCAAPGAFSPCTEVATVGSASRPPPGADALVFDPSRPRVDLLSVEAPAEVPLGSAAEVWATVRVRRAPGLAVAVTARSTGAAPVSSELRVEGADAVRTVRLVVAPLAEGVSFVAVEARIAGEAQAQDGRLLALATRARTPRRVVLAASPGWEARAAAEALEATGARVEALTLLGSRAVAARGRAAEDPRHLLAEGARPDELDLLVLVGFSERDFDRAAAAGLRRYVESGGAALLLESPGAARALGIELVAAPPATPERPLLGRLESGEAFPLLAYPPTSALLVPPGTTVLGRLGGREEASPAPWLLGRSVGKGRLAVVTAPDLWRLSPPGQGRQAYQGVLRSLVGWLEAPRASRAGVVLAEDWTSLGVFGAAGPRSVPLAAEEGAAGLGVDPVDPGSFIAWPRARLRAAAARRGHPFLEPDGAEALARAFARLPPAPRWTAPLPLRFSDAAFCLLAALVALEAAARRLYRRPESGSPVRTPPSSGDTGGRTTGEGRSQRESAMPAARAAAAREGPSSAA